MNSFLGDTKLKSAMVKEIEKHRKADQILKGTYGHQNGIWKGCAVGCSLRSLAIIKGEKLVEEYNQHSRYETDLGIPEWLARLEDTLFEGMPQEDAMKWPGQFIKSIPVGVDLEPIKWKFCAYLMKENIDRVLTLKISDDLKKQVVDAIRGVLVLNEEAIRTGKWNWSAARSAARSAESAARSAESAAWSAARSAESAAWSAARSAAESAARSAESAARSAAESAESAARSAESAARSAESAAWSAARSAAYLKHSKYLLKLLKEAK